MVFETLKRFIHAELGAVTVEFVSITAVIVGFGMGVMLIVAPGIQSATETIEPVMQSSDGLAGRLLGTSD